MDDRLIADIFVRLRSEGLSNWGFTLYRTDYDSLTRSAMGRTPERNPPVDLREAF
jgi:hypothetical protein